jgi:SAM-dependent methyltransferase
MTDKKIDDHAYWRSRHQTRAQGGPPPNMHPRVLEFYLRLAERQYRRLFEERGLEPTEVRVLDAGSGSGLITKILHDLGCNVTAVDISKDALAQLAERVPGVRTVQSPLGELDLPDASFDLVNCSEVLYHVIDDEEWTRALETFARISGRFITIKGPTWEKKPMFLLPHVKYRPHGRMNEVLEKRGFREVSRYPVRYVIRPWNQFILGRLPWLMIRLEDYFINTRKGQHPFAELVVYEKQPADVPSKCMSEDLGELL